MTNKTTSLYADLFTVPNEQLTKVFTAYHSEHRYLMNQVEKLNQLAVEYNTLRTLIPAHLLPEKCASVETLSTVIVEND